jgi:hypothetical protein
MALIGSVFIAAVAVAYAVGFHSRPEGSSSPVSRKTAEIPPLEAGAGKNAAIPQYRNEPGDHFPKKPDRNADDHAGNPEEPQNEGVVEREAENFGTESFRPDPYVLKQHFPDNQAVPPATREEFMKKQDEREKREKLYGRIAANKASRQEIDRYYREQERLAEDSIEILLYILTEHADEMSETSLKKHEFLLENFYKRLERIPEKKQAALDRLDKKQSQYER